MATIEDFFSEKIVLPSPPAVALKILEAVRQDQSSFDDLAQIIMADPALTARILKFANSCLFGFPKPVNSMGQATSLIGTNALKNLALSFVIVQDFQRAIQDSFDMDLFWRRSITAAIAADTIAKHVALKDDNIFTSALLQDIGVLILYLADSRTYAALLDKKRINGKTTFETEQQQFGFDHTEVSHYLLTTWGVPEEICQPILLHHSKKHDNKFGDSAQILRLADKISAIYHGTQSSALSQEVHKLLSKTYRMGEKETDGLIDEVGSKAQEILELFEINPGDIKPFSLIMQEANEELGRLNFSYSQMVLELKQAKQNAEKLAIELKQANDSLRELVFRDGLTGLYNHRFFQETLESELKRGKRYNFPVSIILADIDFFKKVNDTFGHPAGDHVLQKVGDMLIKLVRHCDIASRYGGEEFCVILPETSISGAKVLAERIRRGIEQMKIKHDNQIIPITISCGLASSDSDNCSTPRDVLIKRSDQALYRAKENGRNRVEA